MHMKPMHAFMADDVVFSSDRRRLDGLPHQVCDSRHRYRVACYTSAANCVASTKVAELVAPGFVILTNIKVHVYLHGASAAYQTASDVRRASEVVPGQFTWCVTRQGQQSPVSA